MINRLYDTEDLTEYMNTPAPPKRKKCNRCKLIVGEDEWHYKCTTHNKLCHIECNSESARVHFQIQNNANYSNCVHVEVNVPRWFSKHKDISKVDGCAKCGMTYDEVLRSR